MRQLMRALRIAGGCWFVVFVFVALIGLGISTNVSTGRVRWPDRLPMAGLGLAFAVPGLVAWILANRWLNQPPSDARGFSLLPRDEKH
jgi:hypothetical protein